MSSFSSTHGFKSKEIRKGFPKALQPFFQGSWIVVKTIDDGNCGPDAVAKALTMSGREGVTIAAVRQAASDSISWDNFSTFRYKLTHYAEVMNFEKPELAEAAELLSAQARAAATPDDLRPLVRQAIYFLDNDDIVAAALTFGVYPVIINQTYKPTAGQRKRKSSSSSISNHLRELLVLCSPYISEEAEAVRHLSSRSKGKPVIVMYNRSDANHYELLYKLEGPDHTAMRFSRLPEGVRAWFRTHCIAQVPPLPEKTVAQQRQERRRERKRVRRQGRPEVEEKEEEEEEVTACPR